MRRVSILIVLTVALAWCACGDYKCNPPDPTLVSISPTTARVGTPINLTAKGTDFVSITMLSWDGVSQTTTVVNGTTLTATITGDTSIGTHDVRVQSGSFCPAWLHCLRGPIRRFGVYGHALISSLSASPRVSIQSILDVHSRKKLGKEE
jgi:hypothetical protein